MIVIKLQIFTGNNLSKDETDAELAKVKRELAELRAKEIIRSETKSALPRGQQEKAKTWNQVVAVTPQNHLIIL